MTDIPRKPCKSSNIKSWGYHPDSKTLAVEFHSGDVHHFKDVDPSHSLGLEMSDSIGKYLHQHIKGKHESEKQ